MKADQLMQTRGPRDVSEPGPTLCVGGTSVELRGVS
jgi:hypothetical protein